MLYCPNFFWNVLQVWMTGKDVYLQMTWNWPDKTWNILCSYCLQWNTSQSKFRNHYFLFLFAFSILSQLFLIWGCRRPAGQLVKPNTKLAGSGDQLTILGWFKWVFFSSCLVVNDIWWNSVSSSKSKFRCAFVNWSTLGSARRAVHHVHLFPCQFFFEFLVLVLQVLNGVCEFQNRCTKGLVLPPDVFAICLITEQRKREWEKE